MRIVRFLAVLVIAAGIDVGLLDGAVTASLVDKSVTAVRGFGYEIASFVQDLTMI